MEGGKAEVLIKQIEEGYTECQNNTYTWEESRKGRRDGERKRGKSHEGAKRRSLSDFSRVWQVLHT